ncbi:MAG TPA: hypothetical protein DD490_28100, partial [Acidobacteria bacterium]|nr:hypothetical protein [Acidobacteriota bacterium]
MGVEDGRRTGGDVDQAQLAQPAQDAAPGGIGEVAQRREEGGKLGIVRLAERSHQPLLGRAVEEAEQAQHGDFRAGLSEMAHIGREEV